MKGLLAILAKGKPPAEEGDEKAPESSPGGKSEDEYAGLAFDALQDGDREGFAEAFKGAVRACVKAQNSGAYEPDADDAA